MLNIGSRDLQEDRFKQLEKYSKLSGHTSIVAIKIFKQFDHIDLIKETISFMQSPLRNLPDEDWRLMIKDHYVEDLFYKIKYKIVKNMRKQMSNVSIIEEYKYSIFDIYEVFLHFLQPASNNSVKNLTYYEVMRDLKRLLDSLDVNDEYDKLEQCK